ASGQRSELPDQLIRVPDEQAFINNVHRMNTGAEDPNRGISSLPLIGSTAVMSICEHGSQKRLPRLDYMRKSYGPLTPLYRLEFARDRFACSDALQQLR